MIQIISYWSNPIENRENIFCEKESRNSESLAFVHCNDNLRAARASNLVESKHGSTELLSLSISGISVHPRITQSHSSSFLMRSMMPVKKPSDSGVTLP